MTFAVCRALAVFRVADAVCRVATHEDHLIRSYKLHVDGGSVGRDMLAP